MWKLSGFLSVKLLMNKICVLDDLSTFNYNRYMYHPKTANFDYFVEKMLTDVQK